MRLAELSPAEERYLNSPLPLVDHWTPLLTKRLARMLSARMKQAVEIIPAVSDSSRAHSPTQRTIPEILWDSALDAMWVRARLGGRVTIHTSCTALSRNLQHSLQQLLAETWRSTRHEILPASLCWRIETSKADSATPATLTIHFPDTLSLMDSWAQRMIAS